jgi:hypothetical protein
MTPRQQAVYPLSIVMSSPVAVPSATGSDGAQLPGSYTGVVAILLPRAEPMGTLPQAGIGESTPRVRTAGAPGLPLPHMSSV